MHLGSKGAMILGLLFFTSLLTGCQTTKLDSALTPLLGEYNLFRTPADHVAELLAQKKISEASKIYNDQTAYFLENRSDAEVRAVERKLAQALWQELSADFSKNRAAFQDCVWPTGNDKWPRIKDCLNQSSELLANIQSHTILTVAELRPQELTEFEAWQIRIKYEIVTGASDELKKFNSKGTTDFFSTYPLLPDFDQFYKEHGASIRANLAQSGSISLSSFVKNVDPVPDELAQYIADLYYNKLRDEFGYPKMGIGAAIRALEERARLNLAAVSQAPKNGRTGVILLRDKADEHHFPVELKDSDLPIETFSLPIGGPVDLDKFREFDFLIFVHVDATRSDRKVADSKPVSSQYQVATKTLPNLDYLAAQARVREKELHFQSAVANDMTTRLQAGQCYGSGCLGQALSGIATAIGKSKAQNDLNNAIAQLRATSPTIEQPVYKPYEFVGSVVRTSKEMHLTYYALDSRQKRQYAGSAGSSAQDEFNVNFGILDSDYEYDKHMSDSKTAKELDEYLSSTVSFDVNSLLEKIVSTSSAPTVFASLDSVWRDILGQGRSAALRRPKSDITSIDAIGRSPKFFESVVKIITPSAQGSGFYVSPDLVVTNAHVVSEFKFADVRQHDGTETFGKVVYKDLRRDLAILRVNKPGSAARLFSRTVPIGGDVLAVGHPKGFSFSLTRGIVSAIRKLPSKKMPSAPEVLFVQTDAAINTGNSGGPLFLIGSVVGVNTQGYRKDQAEGLNFAVHVSELSQFLKENGITATVDSRTQ